MKFFAVLKDSLREAVDTKVFYVMVGLSVLVTLVTFTMTFKPQPVGKEVMDGATAALLLEPSDGGVIDNPEELRQRLLKSKKGMYEVVSAAPVNDGPDAPSSRYRVVLRMTPTSPGQADNEAAFIEHIRTRFGKVEEFDLATAEDVRRIPAPDGAGRGGKELYFELTAKPSRLAYRLWPHSFSLFFGGWRLSEFPIPLGAQLFGIEYIMVGWIGASVTVLVSIIITAFFIPNMLRKGTVDLLIVKPIHRSTLLLYKFLGGLLFIGLNTAVVVTGVWLALGVRSGIWSPAIFYMIPVMTFSFAVLYSVSTLFAVLTRSAIVAILMTCGAWVVLFVVSQIHSFWDVTRAQEKRENTPVAERDSEGAFPKVINAMHYVLPRRGDLDRLTRDLLIRDLLTANQIKAERLNQNEVSWTESITVTMCFIALLLGISCWWFSTKDY